MQVPLCLEGLMLLPMGKEKREFSLIYKITKYHHLLVNLVYIRHNKLLRTSVHTAAFTDLFQIKQTF